MSRKDFLYKEIEMDSYEEIRSQFIKFYQTDLEGSEWIPAFFNPVEIKYCLDNVPAFDYWCKEHNLTVRGTTFIRARPKKFEGIHIDCHLEHYTPEDGVMTLALNIPLTENCLQSDTIWYRVVDGVRRMDEIVNPIKFIPFVMWNDGAKYEEIEKINLKTSTFLNIRVPHNVVNNSDSDRVAVSIRFTTDPWWLVGL